MSLLGVLQGHSNSMLERLANEQHVLHREASRLSAKATVAAITGSSSTSRMVARWARGDGRPHGPSSAVRECLGELARVEQLACGGLPAGGHEGGDAAIELRAADER